MSGYPLRSDICKPLHKLRLDGIETDHVIAVLRKICSRCAGRPTAAIVGCGPNASDGKWFLGKSQGSAASGIGTKRTWRDVRL
jgi:hypothetical protein